MHQSYQQRHVPPRPVLQGSAVLNESGLTGESMPVQKLALPNEADREYDAHGAGTRNTLFAGTTVLQVCNALYDHFRVCESCLCLSCGPSVNDGMVGHLLQRYQ
jgi:magnesium-transporting ATPase (P-type)